jgi:hypothetical protein
MSAACARDSMAFMVMPVHDLTFDHCGVAGWVRGRSVPSGRPNWDRLGGSIA